MGGRDYWFVVRLDVLPFHGLFGWRFRRSVPGNNPDCGKHPGLSHASTFVQNCTVIDTAQDAREEERGSDHDNQICHRNLCWRLDRWDNRVFRQMFGKHVRNDS